MDADMGEDMWAAAWDEGLEVMVMSAAWSVAFHMTYWAFRLLSPLCFPVTFRTLDADKGERAYWSATCTAILHAVVVPAVAVVALYADPALLGDDPFMTTTLSTVCCEMFMGYIVQDLLLSIVFNSRWPGWQANIAHHLMVLGGWWMFTTGGFFHGLAMLCLLCELSTPFVSLRWMLDKAKMKDGNLYFFNGLTMLFLFFILRVLLYTWVGFRFWQLRVGFEVMPLIGWLVVIPGYCAGLCLQLFWFTKMAQGALKVLQKRSGSPAPYEQVGDRNPSPRSNLQLVRPEESANPGA